MTRIFLALLISGVAWFPTASAQAEAPKHSAQDHIAVRADELKWMPGPSSLPPGGQMALLEGDPRKPGPFTVRFKLPDGYKIPPHWHPADEHVTAIEGTFFVGSGTKWDRASAKELPRGGFMMMPKGHRHFAGAKGATIIQLHGIGPWQIHYVNPADDPRGKSRP